MKSIIDESFSWTFDLIAFDLARIEFIVCDHINFPVIYDDQLNMQNAEHNPSPRNWKAPQGAKNRGDQVPEKKNWSKSDLKMFVDGTNIMAGSVRITTW